MKDSASSPFGILAIAPTADAMVIKRAYFAALSRHPPHADAEGFRRVRAAYETLLSPEGLRSALALAPVDPAAELTRYRDRYDGPLAAAAAATAQAGAADVAGARFKQALMRMTLQEALARFSAGG